ncbi:MAG: helix-turn-helix transcriptional regulator [Alphaproteobacteria bacterium]|nr:helix-turn-helix transcriptional regulator [Alphaproteobacteria bacterium]
MTPFGDKLRELRRKRGITLKQLAGALELSPAYLSALEHGHRGLPTPALIVQICEYFNLIWDDYEEMHRLARLSHPRVVVDTRGLSPAATELANLIAERIGGLDDAAIETIRRHLDAVPVVLGRPKRRRGPRSIT